MINAGKALSMSETSYNKKIKICYFSLRSTKKIKSYVEACVHPPPKTSVTDNCLFENPKFEMKRHKFCVQNLLIIITNNTVCLKECCNSFISNVSISETHH